MMDIPKGYKLVPVELLDRALLSIMEQGFECDGLYELVHIQKQTAQPIYDEAKERELFELYATTHYRLQELPLDFDDGEYIEPEVQYSWESWEERAKAGEVDHE